MDKPKYNCHYCGKSYEPKRRYVQLYCCTSCRVSAHKRRKKMSSILPKNGLSLPQKEIKNEQKISMAGIGNAAIANIATDLAKNIFTSEENKPVTRGFIKAVLNDQPKHRYLPVLNAANRNDGTTAYYDTILKQVVYLKTLK